VAAFGDEVVVNPGNAVFQEDLMCRSCDDCVAERSLAGSTAATVASMNFTFAVPELPMRIGSRNQLMAYLWGFSALLKSTKNCIFRNCPSDNTSRAGAQVASYC
jgi:hypothetical protein